MSAIMASASSSVTGRSSRSPLLDYTRRTQAEAMESRSAKRIESLVLLDHRVMWIPSHRSLESALLSWMRPMRKAQTDAMAVRTAKHVEVLQRAGQIVLSPPSYEALGASVHRIALSSGPGHILAL